MAGPSRIELRGQIPLTPEYIAYKKKSMERTWGKDGVPRPLNVPERVPFGVDPRVVSSIPRDIPTAPGPPPLPRTRYNLPAPLVIPLVGSPEMSGPPGPPPPPPVMPQVIPRVRVQKEDDEWGAWGELSLVVNKTDSEIDHLMRGGMRDMERIISRREVREEVLKRATIPPPTEETKNVKVEDNLESHQHKPLATIDVEFQEHENANEEITVKHEDETENKPPTTSPSIESILSNEDGDVTTISTPVDIRKRGRSSTLLKPMKSQQAPAPTKHSWLPPGSLIVVPIVVAGVIYLFTSIHAFYTMVFYIWSIRSWFAIPLI